MELTHSYRRSTNGLYSVSPHYATYCRRMFDIFLHKKHCDKCVCFVRACRKDWNLRRFCIVHNDMVMAMMMKLIMITTTLTTAE